MRLETEDDFRRGSGFVASLTAELVSSSRTLRLSSSVLAVVSISSSGGGLLAETDLLVNERSEVASTASSNVSCSGVCSR